MNVGWRPPTEAPYLSYGERTVLRTRLHPMVAVIPFVRLAFLTYASLLAMALFGFVGTIVVLAIFVQWTRWRGYAGGLSFWWATGIFVGLMVLFRVHDDPDTAVYLLILFGLIVAIYLLIEYFFTTIYITDRRIFRVSGLVTRVVATMPLRALTDIRYDQTLLGRVLDYGHFHVESAGQDQALSSLMFVQAPQRFYRIIMSEALGADLPPEFYSQ